MPEGPSIVILKEEAARFKRRRVLRVSGTSAVDMKRLQGRTIVSVRSWGKHFLLEFSGFALRVHFLLFGSYRLNEGRDRPPRLGLGFSKGEQLNFYACSLKFIEGNLDEAYEWSADVMSPAWNETRARARLRGMPNTIAADALLDQNVFAGVGNIIKNEVLHRIRVHPRSAIGCLPPRKLAQLVTQARAYSLDFYRWKKAYVLKKNLLVHAKQFCPRDGAPLSYARQLGKFKRRAFFCEVCQRDYGVPVD